MPFRASSQVKTDGYTEAKRIANRAKVMAQQHRDAMAAGTVSANLVLQLMAEMKSVIERWTIIQATPGMAAYAKDQEDDVNYDVAAEFTAMLNAAKAVRDRIIDDMPVASAPAGVVGRLAIQTIAADGAIATSVFTQTQTALLRADLDTFIATIA